MAELRARLERARLPAAAIDEALEILAEQGYVDDARYARLLVEDRRAIDGWGAERIRARLERAGIERELIEEALAGFDARRRARRRGGAARAPLRAERSPATASASGRSAC